MKASDIQELVESYPVLAERYDQLTERLMRSSGRNPMQEESIEKRLEEVDRQAGIIDYALFESNLTDKESSILLYRSEGKNLQEIGEIFFLTKERIRGILNEVYEKLSDEFKAIAS